LQIRAIVAEINPRDQGEQTNLCGHGLQIRAIVAEINLRDRVNPLDRGDRMIQQLLTLHGAGLNLCDRVYSKN